MSDEDFEITTGPAQQIQELTGEIWQFIEDRLYQLSIDEMDEINDRLQTVVKQGKFWLSEMNPKRYIYDLKDLQDWVLQNYGDIKPVDGNDAMVRPKTFDDLVFNAHANVENGVHAKLDLGNGSRISVVSIKDESHGCIGLRDGELGGCAAYGTYEVAAYSDDVPIPLTASNNVQGWVTVEEINELMLNLQGNPDEIRSFITELKQKNRPNHSP